jgi:hypothetical protein
MATTSLAELYISYPSLFIYEKTVLLPFDKQRKKKNMMMKMMILIIYNDYI